MKGYGAYTYRWYIIQTDSPVLTDKMVIKLDLESCRDEFDRQHSRKMLKRENMMDILKKFIKACEFEYLDNGLIRIKTGDTTADCKPEDVTIIKEDAI